ncbi:hypothetical protein [Dyadobacter sp. Leaf189]|uniref:hypothetical protein n=1 Tax=Dyadobacter sp. Leaf189 TaxID=1736295 RepID=UPI000701306F|nr:hypothetical protein [Dyadobacter sp. Leaf189]KQS30643.1 hypothetical protein ASG33_09620 [Dyadobacter sp. Leaf189]
MSLGDHFPESFREEFVERNIEVGCVIRLFVNWTIPPKEKRFVIVAIGEDYVSLAMVLINTRVNEHVNFSDELRSLHIPVDSAGREYLHHNSYIDCTDLHEESMSHIRTVLQSDSSNYLGKMNEEDLAKVHRLIMVSKTIKPYKKKKFGF